MGKRNRKSPDQPDYRRKPSVDVNGLFKGVVWFAIIFTFALFLADVLMTWYVPQPTDTQARAMEGFSDGWKMAMGAVIGLFSGKSLDSFTKQHADY